jgi:hypothetical protein
MHMLHRSRRLTARFLAIGLLAATLFTVDSLASPSPAQARCNGVNNPVYSWFRYNRAAVQASETPGAGTCNGNNTYSGQLKDEAQDGYCVSVWFQETGTGGWVPPDSGSIVVCGAGNKATFSWNDRNGNSYVYEQFYVHRASDLVAVACGWGDQWAPPSLAGGPYGVNHGY